MKQHSQERTAGEIFAVPAPFRIAGRTRTMSTKQATAGQDYTVIDSPLMTKVFCAFAGLALLSLAISFGGRWFGHSIALGGYSDDTTVHAVMIGDNVLAVPANTIRFADARRDGPAPRLDLYLRYPAMDGYSDAARDDFNGRGGRRNILFLAFEPQMMSRGMSGRFAPIYQSLIEQPGTPGPHGIIRYAFKATSGYLNEVLAVAYRPGQEPFVARCLSGESARETLAPCERDILVGDRLSLTYRFPEELLGDWQALDKAVAAEAERILKMPR
jgi:hypothetical protein